MAVIPYPDPPISDGKMELDVCGQAIRLLLSWATSTLGPRPFTVADREWLARLPHHASRAWEFAWPKNPHTLADLDSSHRLVARGGRPETPEGRPAIWAAPRPDHPPHLPPACWPGFRAPPA